jgi:hypothetical protein
MSHEGYWCSPKRMEGQMSSQPVSADRTIERTRSKIRVTPTETKPSFLTTEF